MIPKIHAKGCSFKGAANYLLHDKDRATTNDRVAWTSTRNLATRDPNSAWRVMAATAMDQNRLKAAAGVKNTGRKSVNSVLHLTLSWHPEEANGLTRDEMMRAANGAVRALGAQDRQALFVSHDDEPQPHVHVLINRVSPADGKMLSSSKEKLRLSRWAQQYETERGEILCEQRVINNAARGRGEYTRGEPAKPRHIYELEAANDNKTGAREVAAEQKTLDYALARRTRDMNARHASRTAELAAHHREKRDTIKARARVEILRSRDRVRADFRTAWEARFHEHQAELRAFERREDQLLGRVGNALRSIDLRSILTSTDRKAAVMDAYNAISSAGSRLAAFKRDQLARDRELERQQKAKEAEAIAKVKAERSRGLTEQRALFKAERASLILTHDLERAGNRTEWKTRSEQRRAAFEKNRFHGKTTGPGQTTERDFSEQTRVLAETLRKAREDRKRDRNRGHER